MVKNAEKPDKKVKKDKKDKKEKKEKKKSKKERPEAQEEEIVEEIKAEEIKVEEKTIKQPSWQPKQLFVSGIPYDTTNEQLLDFFTDEKESIRDVKMPVFQDSGRCMGYAHVTFTTKDAYESAKTKSGQRLGGRYLDIKEAQGT